jgi:uncharacterized membrane protein
MTQTTERADGWLEETLERQTWLDRLGNSGHLAIERGLAAAGRPGEVAIDLLQGSWLGHPLHPALTHVPIGAWTATVALDVLDASDRRGRYRHGADAALAVGVAGAVGAALTGIADWRDTAGATRRLGVAHALLNSGALVLMTGSMLMRGRGLRRDARLVASLGYGLAMAAGYLGGHLVFRRGMGVDRAPRARDPERETSPRWSILAPRGRARHLARAYPDRRMPPTPLMPVTVRWTPDELLTVLAALDQGAEPQLAPEVTARIRTGADQQVVIEDTNAFAVDLTFAEGQLLKHWCDDRRAHAQEQDPNAIWTRIAARVNEAVQWAAPAKE